MATYYTLTFEANLSMLSTLGAGTVLHKLFATSAISKLWKVTTGNYNAIT
jgi:hypothetical protein